MIVYQVFANNGAYSSDVLEFESRDAALKAAIKWSNESKDTEVCVLRVTTVEDVSVTNGVVTDRSCESK